MKRCSKCGEMHGREDQRYCNKCHAAYMRAHRPKHRALPPLAKLKAHTRSYTHTLVQRGKIKRLPCERCGNERSQAHHPNYNDPYRVIWVCRPCHLAIHREEEDARMFPVETALEYNDQQVNTRPVTE